MSPEYKLPLHILGPHAYRVTEPMVYESPRYKKRVIVPEGFVSDGASGPAMDITTRGWIFHDWFCDGGSWTDGSKPTRWESSSVLYDMLKEDGYTFRAPCWRIATWVAGWF